MVGSVIHESEVGRLVAPEAGASRVEPAGAALRDYLAEERTFLAWIRTGVALMGFGLVVANFGLVDGLHGLQRGPAVAALSPWFGAILVAAGAALNLLSARRYVRIVRELNRDQAAHFTLAREGVVVAVFLALAGVAMLLTLVLSPATA